MFFLIVNIILKYINIFYHFLNVLKIMLKFLRVLTVFSNLQKMKLLVKGHYLIQWTESRLYPKVQISYSIEIYYNTKVINFII